jgi:hypothetical protein
MSWSYTSSPPKRLIACRGTALLLLNSSERVMLFSYDIGTVAGIKIKSHDKENGITKHKEKEMKFIPYAVIYDNANQKMF